MSLTPSAPRAALLDTAIFSEFLRGRNATVARRAAAYEAAHGGFTLSVVTPM